MLAVMWLAAILAGVVHVLIFCMESLWWTTPQVRGRFRQTAEQAAATKLFAFNQGFYNLFLAIGTFAGLALVLLGYRGYGLTLVTWSCLSMLGAAIVLVASAPQLRRGALIQGAAPLLFLLLVVFAHVLGAQNSVGIFTTHSDVGNATGSASYDPQQQTYLVAGSGQNMWDTRDDFHFVWKRLTGNFILATRARFIGPGVEEHRKIGWSIRPSLDTNSAHVTAALHGDGLMSLQFRRQTGGITEEAKSADSLPDADAVIQLERRAGEYFMSVARVGDTLVTQRLTGVALPDTVYVGLFVCAHNDSVTERATFSNVRITTPARRGPS